MPFEEDENDPSIWFLDHSYLEKMSGMFRRINGARTSPPALFPRSGRSFETRAGSDKATAALQKIRFGSVRFFLVAEPGGAAGEPSDLFSVVLYPRFASPRIAHPTAKEKIVGWYSTGPKIRAADLDIHALFAEYCATPAFCIIDTRPDRVGIPVSAYLCENEIRDDGTQKEEKTFVHIGGIAHPTQLNDEVVKVRTGLQHLPHSRHEVTRGRAAHASILELHHFYAAVLSNRRAPEHIRIHIYCGRIIDEHGDPQTVAVLEEMLESGRLSCAQEPAEQGHWWRCHCSQNHR